MDKILEFVKRPHKRSKVFHFVMRGELKEFHKCMSVLHILDLDKHGIQFLCIKDEGISNTDGTRNINGLIEMKEGTTIEEVMRFFSHNKIPLWDRISMTGVCFDVNSWLKHYIKKKNRFVGVVLEKGTLTVPPYSPLFNGSC